MPGHPHRALQVGRDLLEARIVAGLGVGPDERHGAGMTLELDVDIGLFESRAVVRLEIVEDGPMPGVERVGRRLVVDGAAVGAGRS